jgi:uncharacterized protein YigA (DUF484 family)
MAMELQKNNAADISEDDVAQYLKSHSGFFLKRDDLLMELSLGHPSSGAAVSLLERQVSLLRERNMDVRGRLNHLLDNAQGNDQLFDKTKALVLALIEATSLNAVVNTFNRSLLSDFSVDYSSMTLFGNRKQHRKLSARMVDVDEAYSKIPGLLRSNKATCGILRPEEFDFLFAEQGQQVKSAAVLPLVHGQALGVIAIGSSSADYFSADMSTLFLNYIGDVISRIVPRHLD